MKKILIVIITLFTLSETKAQIDYQHALGASIYLDLDYYQNAWEGITYSPRITVLDADPLSITAVSRATLGFYYDSDYGGYLGFDIPVGIELNAGLGSTSSNDAGFGGYVGAGFDYNMLVGVWKTAGPQVNGGLRCYLGGRYYELNAGYTIDVTDESSNLIAVGLSYFLSR